MYASVQRMEPGVTASRVNVCEDYAIFHNFVLTVFVYECVP